MPALYPSMVAPEDFCPGESVRKFITEWNVSPYVGVVTQVVPSTYKVWVQWPMGNTQEDPETLVKVNPAIFGMPTVHRDYGYSSYEKAVSDAARGPALPKRQSRRVLSTEKMAIRIAHTFANDVVGKLVDEIGVCMRSGFSDVQAYNSLFNKYGSICSDHIIRSSIQKIYTGGN